MNETNDQSGGNPFILKAASDLIVPMALTAGAHWWGSHIEQKGGANSTPILDDPILQLYMKNKHIDTLTPHTLIPAGIIVSTHNSYSKNNLSTINPNKSANENIGEQLKYIVDKNDLNLYMKKRQINQITPQTKLPFAILMGPHIFSEHVKEI